MAKKRSSTPGNKARNRYNRKQSGNASAFYAQVADALQKEGRAQATGTPQALAAMRYVGNRCFYNAQGRWYDSRFDETKADKVQNVKIGSTEYVELLNNHPTIAKYMSQGDVTLEFGGQWYRFEQRRG